VYGLAVFRNPRVRREAIGEGDSNLEHAKAAAVRHEGANGEALRQAMSAGKETRGAGDGAGDVERRGRGSGVGADNGWGEVQSLDRTQPQADAINQAGEESAGQKPDNGNAAGTRS